MLLRGGETEARPHQSTQAGSPVQVTSQPGGAGSHTLSPPRNHGQEGKHERHCGTSLHIPGCRHRPGARRRELRRADFGFLRGLPPHGAAGQRLLATAPSPAATGALAGRPGRARPPPFHGGQKHAGIQRLSLERPGGNQPLSRALLAAPRPGRALLPSPSPSSGLGRRGGGAAGAALGAPVGIPAAAGRHRAPAYRCQPWGRCW